MRRRIFVAATAIVTAMTIASGMWLYANGMPMSRPQYLEGDYGGYATFPQLVQASDEIAVVKVVRNLGSYTVPWDPISNNPPPSPPTDAVAVAKLTAVAAATPVPTPAWSPGGRPSDPEPIETKFLLQVDTPLAGHLAKSAQLTLVEIGGTVGGKTQVIVGNPLPRVGDTEVLFLSQNHDHPGTYNVVAGPEGRFAIANGVVLARAPNVAVGRRFDGQPLAVLTSAIQAAAGPMASR